MTCGLLLVDKPAGISSAAVVATVKRRLHLEKVGHAGTLDPMATGLLVCLSGAATRLATFAEGGRKIYSGSIRLGLVTDSDDITGEPIARSGTLPAAGEVETASRAFVGSIMQAPPRVSAVKVNGKRSYELARAGVEVIHPERPAHVYRFEISAAGESAYDFVIECEKGTYIRSIARDLGAALGCGGCLASLRRESSYPFTVAAARPLDDIGTNDLRSWLELFPEALSLPVDPKAAERLRGGDMRALDSLIDGLRSRLDYDSLPDRAVFVDRESGKAGGLLVRREGRWRFGVNL